MDGQGSGHCIDQDHVLRNYEVLPFALVVEEQGDEGGGFGGQWAHDLDPHAMNQSSPEDEVDDRRPWAREVYVKACDDSRRALQEVEDHLGMDQVTI